MFWVYCGRRSIEGQQRVQLSTAQRAGRQFKVAWLSAPAAVITETVGGSSWASRYATVDSTWPTTPTVPPTRSRAVWRRWTGSAGSTSRAVGYDVLSAAAERSYRGERPTRAIMITAAARRQVASTPSRHSAIRTSSQRPSPARQPGRWLLVIFISGSLTGFHTTSMRRLDGR